MNEKRKGGYREIEFATLADADPAKASIVIRSAWQEEPSVARAAKRLGMSRRSFYRYAKRLSVEAPSRS